MTNNYIVEWFFFTKGGKVPSDLQIDDVLLRFRKYLFDLHYYDQYKPTFVQSLDTSSSEEISGQNHSLNRTPTTAAVVGLSSDRRSRQE
jgi:hypothetical protein